MVQIKWARICQKFQFRFSYMIVLICCELLCPGTDLLSSDALSRCSLLDFTTWPRHKFSKKYPVFIGYHCYPRALRWIILGCPTIRHDQNINLIMLVNKCLTCWNKHTLAWRVKNELKETDRSRQTVFWREIQGNSPLQCTIKVLGDFYYS